MVLERKAWRLAPILLFLSMFLAFVHGEPLVPCMFIFGDSAIDNGNNNILNTSAKGNYYPYGIDFPGGATGRFTNGRTQADLVSELLGFDHFIPPFETAYGVEILEGVNFASAGAGIQDDTGHLLGQIATLNQQIRNFKHIVSRMTAMLRDEEATAKRLNKCIYWIMIGNDDFLDNLITLNTTVDHFIQVLMQEFTGQLWTLYGYGARKIVLNGLGQGGCIPLDFALVNGNQNPCQKGYDLPFKKFNNELKKLVLNFNSDSDATFIYIDGKGVFDEIVNDPYPYGFKVTDSACCGAGKNNAETLCPRFQTPCPNRTEFVFWDSFHLTEAVNVHITNRAFRAQKLTDAFPFDIQHLAQL